MADGKDEADELTLLRGQGGVAWSRRPAEERHRVLVRRSTAPNPYVDSSLSTTKVRSKSGSASTGAVVTAVVGRERRSNLWRLEEPVLAEEGSQGSGDGAKFPDKLAVVPG